MRVLPPQSAEPPTGVIMGAVLKKGVPLLLIVFIGYYLFTDPKGLADAGTSLLSTTWQALTNLFNAVINFADIAKS
ncbi:MAG TPA: hypothetical protein P5108_05375 [Marmoricola sp.]|nr:hypothetical protein [Marmoricola sp.]